MKPVFQTRNPRLVFALIIILLFIAADATSVAFAKNNTGAALSASKGAVPTAPVQINGVVYLQGAQTHQNIQIISVSDSYLTGSNGAYTIYANSPFTLYLSAYGYLAAEIRGSAPANGVTLSAVTMYAGDLNADLKIDILDLSLLATYYNTGDSRGDINRDGVVDISDITLTAANYAMLGPSIFNPAPTTLPPTVTPPSGSFGASGVVYDPGGNPVSGASVTISQGGSPIETLLTNSAGQWASASLPAGVYEFKSSAANFGAWAYPRIIDTAASNSNILLTLPPPTNAVASPEFEESYLWSSWEEFDGNMSQSALAFDGQYGLTMGEGRGQEVTCYQNNRPGELWTLKQRVTIPDIDYAGLSFVYKTDTSQRVFDYAWFEVVLMVNNTPYYLEPWGQLWQSTDWTLRAYDLSRWRGQTVDLRFQTVHCSSQSFTATLDRVSIGKIKGLLPAVSQYQGSYRKLDACENMGNHNLFIHVVDRAGKGIPGVRVKVSWPDGSSILSTGEKAADPGLADFPTTPGSYYVEVLDGDSDVIGPLSSNIPTDEYCGGSIGNSYGHYSYEVTFVKNY